MLFKQKEKFLVLLNCALLIVQCSSYIFLKFVLGGSDLNILQK